MKKTLLAASLGLAFFLPAAEAALFNFSYTMADSRVLSGQLDGTLQADNNSVLVNSILNFASFGGSPLPSMPYIESSDGDDFPTLTFDGSYMNFSTYSEKIDAVSFSFNVDTTIGNRNYGDDFFSIEFYRTSTYDGESFNPANWSLSSDSENLPIPATLPLLLMGGVVMAYRRRKVS
jgi:hypothetical protein